MAGSRRTPTAKPPEAPPAPTPAPAADAGDAGAQVQPPAPAVTLDQLTPEAKAQLLAELAATQAAVQAAATAREAGSVEAAVEARRQATAALMHDRDHLRDCPGGRVEYYEARRPAKPADGIPAKNVTVVRCIECGGSTVIEQEGAATTAQIDQAVAAATARARQEA